MENIVVAPFLPETGSTTQSILFPGKQGEYDNINDCELEDSDEDINEEDLNNLADLYFPGWFPCDVHWNFEYFLLLVYLYHTFIQDKHTNDQFQFLIFDMNFPEASRNAPLPPIPPQPKLA